MFIVVDALDECADSTQAGLLTALRSLAGTVNLLVTSRNTPSREFYGNKQMNIRANEQDVRRYIQGRIPQTRFLKLHVDKDPALQEEIMKAIAENIDGMSVSPSRVLNYRLPLTIYKGFY